MIRITIDLHMAELEDLDAAETVRDQVESLVDELIGAGVEARWSIERTEEEH